MLSIVYIMSIVVSNLKKDRQSAIVANRSYRRAHAYYPNPGTEKDNTIVNYIGGAPITPIKTAIRMDKQRKKAERFERVMGNVYSNVDNAMNLRDFRAETHPKSQNNDFVREEYNPQYDPQYNPQYDSQNDDQENQDIPDPFYEAKGDESDGEETKRPDFDENPNKSEDMWDESHRVEEIPEEEKEIEVKEENPILKAKTGMPIGAGGFLRSGQTMSKQIKSKMHPIGRDDIVYVLNNNGTGPAVHSVSNKNGGVEQYHFFIKTGYHLNKGAKNKYGTGLINGKYDVFDKDHGVYYRKI